MTAQKQLEDAVFFTALQVEHPTLRKEFLDHACMDDMELRVVVEELLALQERAEMLMNRGYKAIASSADEIRELPRDLPEAVSESVDEWIGKKIDRYMILEVLGRGGCGDVYLAEQEKPVRRTVALKVIKLGMDTRSVIARFDAERQALAMMEHANIAKVLDAGATDTGRPYFVLELVRGTRITDYCDANRCDIRQRLELFMQVCKAIQHAHQKGVIHCDIKPSNVLVEAHDGVPVPKVIDFGIAKAIKDPLTEETFHTHVDQLLGTPAYMSPEQAVGGGLDVDTRSDVYCLGVLLYELLTGVTPFDPKELSASGPEGMREILLKREPLRPSARLATLSRETLEKTAGNRLTDSAKLISRVREDLDWIVLRALEKDRARRYPTANGLAMDIRRHLANEAIIARPPGRLYLMDKFVRRHTAALSAGAAVLFALVAGLGVSMWLYHKAREAEIHQAELRQVAEKALANEAELRQKSESREKLTQAVVLLRKGDLEGASGILDEIQDPPGRPSLDGVTALRAVGEWLALHGRWQEAARRFQWLVEIDKLDPWGPVTLDCQAGGVVIAECRDPDAYRKFCVIAIGIQSDPDNGDATSRILKTCLLLPPGEDLKARLVPLSQATEAWYEKLSPALSSGWAAIPSCLWRYRSGDFTGAIACTRSVVDGAPSGIALTSTVRLIRAMSLFQIGEDAEARRQLDLARVVIAPIFERPLELGDGRVGFWYDWLFARILLREAAGLIEGNIQSEDRR